MKSGSSQEIDESSGAGEQPEANSSAAPFEEVVQVTVERPVVSGDTVRFAWTQSTPNRLQRWNHFFLRYENLDLSLFSETLWIEIFLAYELKVLAHIRAPI